jgi:transposase-like protein
MRERKEFGREFKLEAIRQLEEGRKNPAELARELGIRRNQLYKWKEQKEFEDWGSGLESSVFFNTRCTTTMKLRGI